MNTHDRKALLSAADADLLAALRSIEPLPPLGMRERVWQKAVAASRRPQMELAIGRRLVWALAVVLMLLSLPNRLPPPAPFAVLWLTSGDVEAAPKGNLWVAGRVGETLEPEARVRTSKGSRACAKLWDAGALFGESTLAMLRRTGSRRRGTEIVLAQGTVAVSAKPRPPEESLRVRAAGYQIEVVGTIFSVRSVGRDLSISVHEGTVAVRGLSTDLKVGAGQSWSNTTGLAVAPMDPNDVALVREMLRPVAAEAPLGVEGRPDAEVEIDGVRIGRAPVQMLSPIGLRQVAMVQGQEREVREENLVAGSGARVVFPSSPTPTPPSEANRPSSSLDTAQGSQRAPLRSSPGRSTKFAPNVLGPSSPMALPPSSPSALIPSPLSALAPPSPTPTEAPRQSAASGSSARTAMITGQRLETAKRLQQSGRYAESFEAYRALARGDSLSAEIALYESGLIQLRQLEDPRGAAATFHEYQRRFPQGTFREEVEINGIEALLQSGSRDSAEGEVNVFLRHHPHSERFREMILLRGNLRRARGNCALAMEDYRLVLASEARDRTADDAFFFSIYCEQKTGRTAEATRRMEQYLKQFPHGRHRHEVETATSH